MIGVRRREVSVEIDGESLTSSQRHALCAWLAENGIDFKRVPLHTTLVRDDVTREWIVEYHTKPVRLKPDRSGVVLKRVRRAIRSYLPADSPAFAGGRLA